MSWRVNVFGVRHLSPMGAWQLRAYLDRLRPKVVLIEGLDDATCLIPDILRKETKPPIAILAYTDSLPIRTLVYPLAAYSPEYQAMCWAKENRRRVEFIDLPSANFLGLQDAQAELFEKLRDQENVEQEPEGQTVPSNADEMMPEQSNTDSPRSSIYEQVALGGGETDYETYWERRFEHNTSDDSYRLASHEFGTALRELEEDSPRRRAESLVREAFMRRRVEQVLAEGISPEQIVAVVGAFHSPVLNGEHPAMTDEELASLRCRASKLTLMPYSYFKLSSQSGYGAGNHAPAYFELMWDTLRLEQGPARLTELPFRYLSLVARQLRESGTHRSTAEVIDGVRLAQTLAAFKEGTAPALVDLRDAAIALLGHGELNIVKEAFARIEVGTAIGQLPEGVSQTSIQSDFDRELRRLKLDKYKSAVKQELSLDLRENRQAKSTAAAFLDLDRSSLFHRLRVLGISFAEQIPLRQESTTWAERWNLQWTPESEISLVEAVLLGETIELATAYQFKTQLEKCTSIADAAIMVRDACQCCLMPSMDLARAQLQNLASQSHEFNAVAHAAWQLSLVVHYRDVRQFDAAPLIPLVKELFVQGALGLFASANCDQAAARRMIEGIDELNRVGLQFADGDDERLWIGELQKLADSDDRNAVVSGYACGILLDRGLVSNESLAQEVSRRLSPGAPADLGAGWFEGLAQRNRYTLLARQVLWDQLESYIRSLDDDQFRRALVLLRRAFGGFSPQEKRHIAENLSHIWGLDPDTASEVMDQPLSQAEEEKLTELNEFDFDDL